MVDFSVLDNLKAGHYQQIWYYFGGALFGVYGGLSSLTLNSYVALALFLFALAMVFLATAQFIKAKATNDKNRRTYLEFAQRNGFTYEPASDSVLNGTGTLFAHGHTKTTKNVLSGKTASGLPLQTFHYEYVTGSGKSSQSHFASVMRITLPRTLPHMVIDSLVEGSTSGSVLPIQFDPSQQVKVEGDFNRYFSLYAPDTYAVSLLSIIGPDVMWALMQHAAACDIEIIDNYIYFYWPYTAIKRSEYEGMFSTADAVMKEVGKKLTKGNIYTSDSQAQLHSATQQGGIGARLTWLKRGTSLAGIVFILGFLLLYAQPFLSSFFGIPPFMGPEPIVVFFAAFVGIVVFNYQRTEKKRRELLQRFGPSEPKH